MDGAWRNVGFLGQIVLSPAQSLSRGADPIHDFLPESVGKQPPESSAQGTVLVRLAPGERFSAFRGAESGLGARSSRTDASSACRPCGVGGLGWTTGFEPATPGITIQCSNQLSYAHRRRTREPIWRFRGCQRGELYKGTSSDFRSRSLLSPSAVERASCARDTVDGLTVRHAPVAQLDRAAAF